MEKYYRIRLEWNNGKWTSTQKGAYLSKDQAIKECTDELIKQGYKVFDYEGTVVYPVYYNKLAEQMLKDGVIEDGALSSWSNIFDNNLCITADFWSKIITKYSEKLEYYKEELYNNSIKDKDDSNTTSNDEFLDISTIFGDNYILYKIPVSKFSIKWHDKPKRQCDKSTYINAGYFGNYKDGVSFTLPSANLVCDIDENNVSNNVLKYLRERKIKNGKLYFSACQNSTNQFKTKNVSTLFVKDGKAYIDQINSVDESMLYAISGFPIIKNEEMISLNYGLDEGWDKSILRPTWHSIIGIDSDNNFIYAGGIKTKSNNAISDIACNLKDLKFKHLLKLDGGGSAYCKVDNNEIYNTSENRQINNIITF